MRGQLHTTTPDDIYREYQNFIPLLPADAHDWSFHLVVMFLNALPVDLKNLLFIKDISCPASGN